METATLTIYPPWLCTNLIGWSCLKGPIRRSDIISTSASLWCHRPVSSVVVYSPSCHLKADSYKIIWETSQWFCLLCDSSQVCGAARPAQPPVWGMETSMWVWERQRRVHSWRKTFWSLSTQTDKRAQTARETEPPSFASAATRTKWFVYTHVKHLLPNEKWYWYALI